jgi:hypothetical protein
MIKIDRSETPGHRQVMTVIGFPWSSWPVRPMKGSFLYVVRVPVIPWLE